MDKTENSGVPPVQYIRMLVRIVGIALLIKPLLVGLPPKPTLAWDDVRPQALAGNISPRVENAPSEPGALIGNVDLQGRTNEQGAIVFTSPGGTAGYLSTSDSGGDYIIPNVPPGTYNVDVEMALYLDSSKSGVVVYAGETTTLNPVRLLGGDCNDDDIIDIHDATILGPAFDSAPGDANWDPQADINANDKVDILDAVLLSGNWNKSSPVPWPWGTI